MNFKLKLSIILFTCFLVSSAQAQECYLQIDGKEILDPHAVSSLAFSLISSHVEPLAEMPAGGIKASENDCIYKVSVNKDQEKIFLALNGRNYNGTGISQLKGLEGIHQALLVALKLIEQPKIVKSSKVVKPCDENSDVIDYNCPKSLNQARGVAIISYQCMENPCAPQSILKLRATDVAKLVAMSELSKLLGVNVQTLQSVKSGRMSKNEIQTISGAVLKGVRFAEPVVEGDEVSIVVTAKVEQ